MDLDIVLREMGFKVTPQRLAIYEVLQNCNMHPTAEMIYNIISVDFPTMSLATVYKTLDLLTGSDIIQELNIGENISRYDINPKPHPHILCTKCGKLEDVDMVLPKILRNRAQTSSGYDIHKLQLYFYGICPYCRDAE